MVSRLVTNRGNNLIRAIAAASSLAVLGACASTPVKPVAFLEIPRINKLTIVDSRPQKDFTSGVLSQFIGDCNFNVIAMPDWTFPDKAARLERDLYAAFGDGLAGHTIEIIKYRAFANQSAKATSMAVGAAMGVVGVFGAGGVPETLHPKCDRAKMTGGWFDPADLTNNGAPYTLDVAIRVEGKTYSATIAVSPLKGGTTYDFSHISADYASDMVTADGKSTSYEQVLARELHRRLIEEMKKGGWSAQQNRT